MTGALCGGYHCSIGLEQPLPALFGTWGDSHCAGDFVALLFLMAMQGRVEFPQDQRATSMKTWPSVSLPAICTLTDDTIANFRKTFLAEIQALFVQVLLLARTGWGIEAG